MEDPEPQREALERLGLSPHQAQVYLILLRRGPLGAAALADAADVPRTRVYEVTKALQEQGLIASTLDAPIRFRALPIRHFVEQARERLRAEDLELSGRLPELERLLPQQEGPDVDADASGFTPLRGARLVKSKLAAVLGSAREEVLVSVGNEVVERLKGLLAEARAAGVKIRVLHHVERETLLPCLRLQENGATFRHAPAPEHLAVFVVDGRDCVIAFPPDARSKKYPAAGVWTDEPHFVQAQIAAFEKKWAGALPLAERHRELERGETPRTTDLLHAASEDDPQANARIFSDAAARTLAGARVSLDIALPAVGIPEIDRDALVARLEAVRGRVLAPLPKTAAEKKTIQRLLAVAEVRESPAILGGQVIVVADGGTCLIATLSRSGPRHLPHWESVIVSTEPGLASSSQRHFEAAWTEALDLDEARSVDSDGHWWSTSRRADDALLWAREALSTAVRSVTVRATADAARLLPVVLRHLDDAVQVTRVIEEGPTPLFVLTVDDHLCLVLEDLRLRGGRTGEVRLERLGHATFTNSPATVRAWQQGTSRSAEEAAWGPVAPGTRR